MRTEKNGANFLGHPVCTHSTTISVETTEQVQQK